MRSRCSGAEDVQNLPDRARRGVSPVPSEVVLIALVVAAGVIVYVFVSGLAGNLTKSGSQPLTQELSLDAYVFHPTGPLTMYLRNVGNTTVTIQAVYFNGQPVPDPGCLATVQPTATIQCSFTPNPMPQAGSSVMVKVVTAAGGVFDYRVMVGSES